MKHKKTTGMLLGKFMPPHMGHMYLARFAENFVDDLTIVVGTLKNEPIAGVLRHQWMVDMFPHVRVVHLTDENPQHPDEHPDFWNIWRDSLMRIMPHRPDFVFAGEDYGAPLADILGATFVPCTMGRGLIPVSATMIRDNPQLHWDYIAPAARPYFLKRICLIGAESTGKSVLAEKLAQHFQTSYVPEYAYTHIQHHGKDLTADDFDTIARAQMASEKALSKSAHKLMICDTDILTTALWAEKILGHIPPFVESHISTHPYDLTLLMGDDVPWVDDVHRYDAPSRAQFTKKCEEMLTKQNRVFVKISGDWDAREKAAIKAIQDIL